jgi:hypothetical protein
LPPTSSRTEASRLRNARSGTLAAKWAPSAMPGREPIKQRDQQHHIHRTQPPVAEAGDEGQRHGVGDVGADDAARGEIRIEEGQRGHAEGTGADRGNRHQRSQHCADQHGQRRGALLKVGAGGTATGQVQQALAEEQRGGGQQQGDSEHNRNQPRGSVTLHPELCQHEKGKAGCRYAAQRETSGDGPVNVAVTLMHP